MEASFFRQKLYLQICCYSVFLMPCNEFLPVKVICVVSKFGCSITVHRKLLFKAPVWTVLQNNEQLGNLTSLLQPAAVLTASHCSQRASNLICQSVHIVHCLKHEQQRHAVIKVLPKYRQKLAKIFEIRLSLLH